MPITELLDRNSEQYGSDVCLVEINPEIIDDEVHRMMNQFAQQLKMQGISLEQYFQFTGTTHEDMHKQMSGEEEKRVRNGNSFRLHLPDTVLRLYSDRGEFLALARVTEGECNTIKSFYEVSTV